MATSGSGADKGTYILGDTGAEMARLIEQDRHFTTAMKGLFPERPDLSSLHSVLDVACGPGGWVLEVAQEYPHIQVTGIDISVQMIEYGAAQAQASGLDNASFQAMDATQPLEFADETFDMVNARFMVGFLPTSAWPRVIAEFLRITKRGGIIRLTESEWGGTTSASYEQSLSYTIQAMQRVGQSFSPDGRHVTITPLIRRFLQKAGCQNVAQMTHAVEFSTGTPLHLEVYRDLWIAQKLLQPFHVGVGVATQPEVDQLYERIPMEMLADDFAGILFLLTAWGEKP